MVGESVPRSVLQDTISRRQFLGSCAVGSAGIVAGCIGNGGGGGEYPSDDFSFIIPYSEGGGMDLWSRHLFPLIADEFGQEVSFENVGGAGGTRGFGQTYRSDPDGYTVTAGSIPLVPLAWLSHEPDWNLTDMEAISIFTENIRLMLYANPDLGLKGIEDLFKRYRSGELKIWGSADTGALESAIAYQLRDNPDYNVPWKNLVEYDGSGPMIEAIAANETPVGIATDSAASGSGYLDQIDLVCSLASKPSAPLNEYVNPDQKTLDDAGYEPFDLLATYRPSFYFPPDTGMDKRKTIADAVKTVLKSDKHAQWEKETGNLGGPWRGPKETQQLLSDSINTLKNEVDLDRLQG